MVALVGLGCAVSAALVAVVEGCVDGTTAKCDSADAGCGAGIDGSFVLGDGESGTDAPPPPADAAPDAPQEAPSPADAPADVADAASG